MENYRAILKETELLCKELNIEITTETKECIAKEIGDYLLNLLDEAEKSCNKNNRKIISAADIMQELIKRNVPFLEQLQ